MIPNYTRIKLITDNYAADGARVGMIGYIIEVYPDGNYEIEFSDPQGTTVAQIVAKEHEIVVVPEARA